MEQTMLIDHKHEIDLTQNTVRKISFSETCEAENSLYWADTSAWD